MYEVIIVIYLIVALAIIGFVLMQQGKGADMGASFGSGGSNTVFGSGGSGNFLTRVTAILAVVFFALSLVLGNLSTQSETDVILDAEKPVITSDVPVSPVDNSDVPQ
ncbi:preprotein translocase subunit SecG [Moritella marina ATCC 15381]|uniref:Protein-export membrane protein SecG n=1 Tax=Moritella marina ATCC 15381 TaxID=1202962 RepID=A0A5J6WGQ2_MORMI|nr:preprotein translocase subunit SecG [Moritella marina]QFI36388.1 preprotein translocase subunit SecG [Moritella marina ATCC 15381]